MMTRRTGYGFAICLSAEGGTSGKNSATDQHQAQNTTGTTGANSPNLTAQDGGTLSQGNVAPYSVYGNSSVSTTDFGAIDAAFAFGDSIAQDLGKVYAASADAGAATQASNSNFLAKVLDGFSSQTDAGQAANTQKTLLYVLGGLIALGALYFLAKKS